MNPVPPIVFHLEYDFDRFYVFLLVDPGNIDVSRIVLSVELIGQRQVASRIDDPALLLEFVTIP